MNKEEIEQIQFEQTKSLLFQLQEANNKIEKIREYCKEQRDIHFFPNPLVYDDILSIIDEENK